jgi:hypothetical protein
MAVTSKLNDIAGVTLDGAYSTLKTNVSNAPAASPQLYGAQAAQAAAEFDLVNHHLGTGRLNASAILAASIFGAGFTSALVIPSNDPQTQILLNSVNQLAGLVKFTGSVGAATSGTLTAAVTPGVYQTTFSNGNARAITVAAGGTAATWTGALTAGTVTSGNMALPGTALFASPLQSTLAQNLDQAQRELYAVCVQKGYTSPNAVLTSAL